MRYHLLEPFKFALKKFESLAFFRRMLIVYKKTKITQYPPAIYKNDFIDLVTSIGLAYFAVWLIINTFPNYFGFDPLKIFNLVTMSLYGIAHSLVFASCIAIFTVLARSALEVKLNIHFFTRIFWRSTRLFSIINIFLALIVLTLLNNLFRHGDLYAPQGLTFTLTLSLIIFPLFISWKLLAYPLYNFLKFRGKIIATLTTFLIFFLTFQVIKFSENILPSAYFINKKELISEIKNSSYQK